MACILSECFHRHVDAVLVFENAFLLWGHENDDDVVNETNRWWVLLNASKVCCTPNIKSWLGWNHAFLDIW